MKNSITYIYKFTLLISLVTSFWSCESDSDSTPIRLIINDISTNTGEFGDEITITGTGFSSEISKNAVRFNGALAVVSKATETEITATVPFRAGPGNITVTVDNEEAPGPFFNIILPPPTVLGYTSFEEPPGSQGDYVDTGDASVDHYLMNNPGQALVEYVSVGGELGFRTFYKSTGSNGLTDGDDVGVTTKTSIVGDSEEGGYTDGTQGYYMDDTDGILILEFDEIDIPVGDFTVVKVEMDYLFNDTDWEEEDYLKVKVKDVETGITLTLLDLNGLDIDAMNLDPEPHFWNHLSGDISELRDVGRIQLLIECKNGSSGVEEVYYDNIKIIGQ